MNKTILIKASLLGAVAVIFGAMGAHALKPLLTQEQLLSFETGVRYQMYHAIVLLIFSFIKPAYQISFKWSIRLFFIGTLLFSGSIYLLTIKNIASVEWLKLFGPITPIGGILLIIGWLLLFVRSLSIKKGE
ncbi:MAG: DUF423 domain-containing protein [Vicingaceae bacterium]